MPKIGVSVNWTTYCIKMNIEVEIGVLNMFNKTVSVVTNKVSLSVVKTGQCIPLSRCIIEYVVHFVQFFPLGWYFGFSLTDKL